LVTPDSRIRAVSVTRATLDLGDHLRAGRERSADDLGAAVAFCTGLHVSGDG